MNRFVYPLSIAAVCCFFIINFAISTGCGVTKATFTPPPVSPTPVGAPLTSGGARYAYAVYDGGPAATTSTVLSALQFALTAGGVITPTGVLAMPAGFSPISVTLDSSGQIYVGGGTANNAGVILVFAAGATGSATPIRTISGFPALYAPTRIAVDSAGLLYVLFGNVSPGVFQVYSATASGSATPLRTVTGPLTQLGDTPSDIRVDKSGNVYVSTGLNSSSTKVVVFGSAADGNVAPLRTLAGASTTLSYILGIDLDSNDNLYVLNELDGAPITSTILEFATGASGNAAPMRTIAGADTGLGAGHALHVDTAGNLYVLGISPASVTGTPHIAAFNTYSIGDALPALTITSGTWPVSDNYDFAIR